MLNVNSQKSYPCELFPLAGAAPQEFYLWDSVTLAAKNALGIKYQLLNYYYTLFYQAHTSGLTVIRALWLNFPDDTNTLELAYKQFMVGGAILVSPVVDLGVTSVTAYFPAGEFIA